MRHGPRSGLRAAWRDIQAHRRLAQGGWRDAWPEVSRFLRTRHLLVETAAAADQPGRLALRTRVALNGTTLTVISRQWWQSAPPAEAEQVIAAHFGRARAAAGAWASVGGAVELLRAALLALSGVPVGADLLSLARYGRAGLVVDTRSILAGVVLPLVSLLLGSLLRLAFRLLLRWRLRTGLARAGIAPAPRAR